MSATYTLFTLNEHLRRVVALNFQRPVWVAAEIAQVSRSRGHWYVELIQKGEEGALVAQCGAMVWGKDAQKISKSLGFSIENLLQEGNDLKCLVLPEFHERFGLKLMVQDIDPAYTIGQWALRRRQMLQRLQAEGHIGRNAQRPLPLVIQRLAVISSPEAAGWQDFREHLAENSRGYAFDAVLFPVAVQGRNAVPEIIAVLQYLTAQPASFQGVVILRGGGGRTDLAAFDDYALCATAARLPLPVFTGIGHDTDESLLDAVVHTAHKTPTAAADFLIHHNFVFEEEADRLVQQIRRSGAHRLQYERLALQQSVATLHWQKTEKMRHYTHQLEQTAHALPTAVSHCFHRQWTALQAAATICAAADPGLALRRGYSLTRTGGKIVRSIADLPPGTPIETQLADGVVSSMVVAQNPK